jgi:hypothetical protein
MPERVHNDSPWSSRPYSTRRYRFLSCAQALLVSVMATGCGVTLGGPPQGAFLGQAGVYNYSPSALQIGNVQQFWWCGQAKNPQNQSQFTDTIQYASLDLTTNVMTGPMTVLAETPGTWDSAFVCNPKVIGGTFANPFGDGQSYSYALYYVGTASSGGNANSIGVAFSQDGIHWKKYGQPVISGANDPGYGVGQPAVYNSDQKSGIWLFYEDSSGLAPTQHVEAISADGIHFTVQGALTGNGLESPLTDHTWGDMAYDSQTQNWYAVFNEACRNPSTTGNVAERGQAGVLLYRIPADSLLSGNTPWQLVASFDTNLLGNESVFIAGLLRDQYGRVNIGPYPSIELFPSISVPIPPWNASPAQAALSAEPTQWDIGKVIWTPNQPLLALRSYSNAGATEVTTGWIDPAGNFTLQSTLGHLYQSPQQGANLAFYGCKSGREGYFISTASSCGGMRLLGLDGFGYSQPPANSSLVPLYSCVGSRGSFVSKEATCGTGSSAGQLLGYALP